MAKTPLTLPFNGTKLRAWREKRGWLQADLSEQCRKAGHPVSRARISRLETGDGVPSPPTIAVLVKVFKFKTTDPLLGGELPKPKPKAATR